MTDRAYGETERGYCVLNADGAIDAEQGQPSGEAAIGVVLRSPRLATIQEISRTIGHTEDHHVAEYAALIEGLSLALDQGISRLRAYLDSELVVNTVNRDSDVEPDHLAKLRDAAREIVAKFADITICWVPREWNRDAQTIAGKALGR